MVDRTVRELLRPMAVASLLFVLVPAHETFHSAIGGRVGAAGLLLATSWAQAQRRPALVALRGLAPFVAHGTIAYLIINSGKPAPILWAPFPIQLWVQSRAFRPRWWLVTLTAAAPVATAVGFAVSGFSWAELGPSFFMALALPMVHAVLAAPSRIRLET